MTTKAYFLISVAEKFYQKGYGHMLKDILRDLEAIPEIKVVEQVSGNCDLLVKVEAPIRTIFVANKILAKEWAKSLRVLHVEPIQTDVYQGLTIDGLTRLRRIIPAEAAPGSKAIPVPQSQAGSE